MHSSRSITPTHSQIEFNAPTNIEINSHSITVDNSSSSQNEYYIDLLPDEERKSQSLDQEVEQDDLYEDVSIAAEIPNKDYRSSKDYVNTPQRKPPVAKKPLPQKPSNMDHIDGISGMSSNRIKPNIPKKPTIQKTFQDVSGASERHSSTDSSRSSSGDAENEEFYENVTPKPAKGGKTTVARTSDNIVMYVNCVVNGIPEKHLQTTEL